MEIYISSQTRIFSTFSIFSNKILKVQCFSFKLFESNKAPIDSLSLEIVFLQKITLLFEKIALEYFSKTTKSIFHYERKLLIPSVSFQTKFLRSSAFSFTLFESNKALIESLGLEIVFLKKRTLLLQK